MKALLSLGVVAILVLSTACLLPVTNQADGASCADDDECKSHRCSDGFCGGSSCELNDPGSCDSGWKCIHSDPDPISSFFGADGSDTCRPTCGHCPGNMHCEKGGRTGETLCAFGLAPLDLAIRAPAVITGRPVTIVAVATPPAGRLVKCEWETGDGKPSETTAGPELTHVFDLTEQGQRRFALRVKCTDDGGRRGSAEEAIDVACQPSTGACVPSVCCEEQGFHCLVSTSGNVCRAPVPPTLTIAGPTTIPRSTRADFTASATGGEGEVRSVTWTFSGSSFDRSGLTVSHSFSDAGPATVRARARTSLGQEVEQTHAITICQTDFGECSSSAPCCAPLACKISGSTMRCQP